MDVLAAYLFLRALSRTPLAILLADLETWPQCYVSRWKA
jgi:hypothetical protein